MASWSEVEREAPELAAKARRFFDAHVHKTVATLRKDGSPRISGTEVNFRDGELYIGSMWLATKALDLRRDGRFALHSASEDPPEWPGDAKVAGVFVEETDPARVIEVNGAETPGGRSHLFRADVTEIVVVTLNDEKTKLVIESWHPGRGVHRQER
jgi:hypothetical protein